MSKTIEVESCMDCRFCATDLYNGVICNLGIGEVGLFYPEEPPANCPLREGAVTVKLKNSEPDYKAEVLKVYPDAYADAQANRWTDQDMLNLINGLLDYTHESHTVLGHDGRDAEYYFNLFVERKNKGQ